MDERQLKYFLAIAEEGSVTRAADRLDVAQPSLSQMLLRLEEELGSKLFQRTSRGVILTKSGQVFKEHALKILSDIQRARDEIGTEDNLVHSEVRVGLPSSFNTLVGSRLVIEVRRTVPGAKLTLVEAMSGHIREWLTRGELDLGVLYSVQDSSHLSMRKVALEELFLVGPAGAFGQTDTAGFAIDAIDIRQESDQFPLILPSIQHGLRKFVEEKIKGSQVALNIQFEIDSLTQIKALVKLGQGYSLLAHAAIFEDLKLGQLSAARIVKPVFRRGVFLARNPSHFPTRASVKVAEIVAEISHDLIKSGEWLATRLRGPWP